MADATLTLCVASLLGHEQVELAALCLASLRHFSSDPVTLRLHEDGTLTAKDADLLAASLGESEIIWRSAADERMDETLAGHPALRAYRRQSPLALKLLDGPLWTGRDFFYCDTDVLFFRSFRGLFERPSDAAVFMTDRQNAYSVRSWHLLRDGRLRLPRRLNTGVIAAPRDLLNLDLLEWFLSKPEFRFAPVWVEQTAWALLAGARPCRLLSPAQMVVPRRGAPIADCIGAHFVGAVRGELPRWRNRLERNASRVVEELVPRHIRSVPAKRCTAFHLAASETRRLLARWR